MKPRSSPHLSFFFPLYIHEHNSLDEDFGFYPVVLVRIGFHRTLCRSYKLARPILITLSHNQRKFVKQVHIRHVATELILQTHPLQGPVEEFFCIHRYAQPTFNEEVVLPTAVMLDQGLKRDLVNDIQKYLEDLIKPGLRECLISFD